MRPWLVRTHWELGCGGQERTSGSGRRGEGGNRVLPGLLGLRCWCHFRGPGGRPGWRSGLGSYTLWCREPGDGGGPQQESEAAAGGGGPQSRCWQGLRHRDGTEGCPIADLCVFVMCRCHHRVLSVLAHTWPQRAEPPSSAIRNEERRRAWRASRESRPQPLPSCEVCATPSPEEVQSWAQSFDKLMRSPAGRGAFRAFLRTEYSEENMLFWLACEELKAEADRHAVDEKARLIYEDYVSILSPKEVSLDSRVREGINKKMQEPSAHTFDDAQLQIYTLMHRDSYPRFLTSPAYRALLLQGGSPSSTEA
ncbi:regulator of G-protein signaling 19 isoform X1 [Phacochoerus africanus]|uniref:regulator of G-protein signaling 19 isoform X1 n=1 Tax=Phacochoerus africanus TaxID=41426 RepID=UPI001FDA022E|nr:regulator of G-protein signaling 19 isoform X1 [Phacochoerus africanus]